MSTNDKSIIEPFLDPRNQRSSLYPIVYQDLWDFYRAHLSSFWVAEEIDLSKDLEDWNVKLNDNERHYLKHVLAFFASSDFIVNEAQEKDSNEVTILEYNFYNADKIARENIHSTAYANMIEAYVSDPNEKTYLYNAVTNIPTVKAKADWFRNYIQHGTFSERLVACAITEGIFFSGSFCAIFWFRKRGLLPGLCDANLLISREEGSHRDFACHVYSKYVVNKLPVSTVIRMIKDAVDIEIQFCSEALPVSLIGMNADLMSQYIRYCSDHLSLQLIGRCIFEVENPFDWMNMIATETKSDFFIARPVSYSKAKVMTDPSENQIKFNEEY